MDEQTTLLTPGQQARIDWRFSQSNLRLLLRYPSLTSGIEQFRRGSYNGTDYIYNDKTRNVIATIRDNKAAGRKSKVLVRYRARSWYSSIIEHVYADPKTYLLIPSTNLSLKLRRIRGELPHGDDRGNVLHGLCAKWEKFGGFHDSLTDIFFHDEKMKKVQQSEQQLQINRHDLMQAFNSIEPLLTNGRAQQSARFPDDMEHESEHETLQRELERISRELRRTEWSILGRQQWIASRRGERIPGAATYTETSRGAIREQTTTSNTTEP